MNWYRCSNQILCKWEGCFVDVGCEPVGDGCVQAYPCCPKCGRTAVVIGGPTVSNHTTLTEPAKQMLEASKVDKILDERGKSYGSFESGAEIMQSLKDVARRGGRWPDLHVDQREAVEMIASKLGRILNGDPDHLDSWQDIAGYAQLIVNRLEANHASDNA